MPRIRHLRDSTVRFATTACVLLIVPLCACSDGGFDDEDYVNLTVELTYIGTDRHPGGPQPTGDDELRYEWHRQQTEELLAAYGITEQEYLDYSREIHEEYDRYGRILRAMIDEFERRNTELEDAEAPEEVKPPPGSFG